MSTMCPRCGYEDWEADLYSDSCPICNCHVSYLGNWFWAGGSSVDDEHWNRIGTTLEDTVESVQMLGLGW